MQHPYLGYTIFLSTHLPVPICGGCSPLQPLSDFKLVWLCHYSRRTCRFQWTTNAVISMLIVWYLLQLFYLLSFFIYLKGGRESNFALIFLQLFKWKHIQRLGQKAGGRSLQEPYIAYTDLLCENKCTPTPPARITCIYFSSLKRCTYPYRNLASSAGIVRNLDLCVALSLHQTMIVGPPSDK